MTDIQSALKSLENQIGAPAQSGSAITIPSQRKNIISWLTIKGVWNLGPRTSDETLGKMYGLPQYLRTVLREQGKGNNKPRRPNISFSTETEVEFEPEPDYSITQEPYPPSNLSFPDIQIPTQLNPSQAAIKPLVESIVRDTIFRAINKEIENQRSKQEIDNKKFQDAIIKTVHEGVNTVLTKSLEANKQIATDIATGITENKIRHENNNLKGLVEDIIFQTYLNNKIENKVSEFKSDIAQPPVTSNLETNTQSHNQFIPRLDPNYHFDPYATRVIRSAISMSENLYVYGDTGCGKTSSLEQVCAVLNKGIVRVNPHDGITREMFLGGMKLINNETIFVEGSLPIAMRNGYIFLVDEISFLPPNLTAILNPVGEKGGKLYIPETSEWITPAPGFCIFATDNTGGKGDRTGQYTGTEVQNTATLDRFAFCLKMDYLPQEKELEMLIKRFPNQDRSEIEKMLRLAKDIRNAFSRGELSITLSTRKLIKFFDQRENNFGIGEALLNTIVAWLDEDDETLVKTMIDRLDLLKGV